LTPNLTASRKATQSGSACQFQLSLLLTRYPTSET